MEHPVSNALGISRGIVFEIEDAMAAVFVNSYGRRCWSVPGLSRFDVSLEFGSSCRCCSQTYAILAATAPITNDEGATMCSLNIFDGFRNSADADDLECAIFVRARVA